MKQQKRTKTSKTKTTEMGDTLNKLSKRQRRRNELIKTERKGNQAPISTTTVEYTCNNRLVVSSHGKTGEVEEEKPQHHR